MNEVIVVENHIPALKHNLDLEKVVMAGAIIVRDAAVIKIQSTFKMVTGARGLSRIIISLAEKTNSTCYFDIGSNLPYARIHELGGIIRPVKAKMLSWVDPDTNERRFAKSVLMPKRPYLRPAMENNVRSIELAVVEALNSAIRGLL